MTKYDTLPVIWPMGAEAAKEKKLERLWDDPDYVAEEKLDGERVVIHVGDAVRLTTRSGSSVNTGSPIEITHRWPQIQTLDFSNIPKNTVLDSEVYSFVLRPEEVAGMLNYKSDVPVPEDILYCAIFDCILWNGVSLESSPWTVRYKAAEYAVSSIGSRLIGMPLKTFSRKRQFFEDIISAGGEGVVLKNIFGKYIQGKKPANVWVKAKKKDTFDCIITGFKPARAGKYHGLVGSVELSQYKAMGEDGTMTEYRLFTVCHASGISDELRRHMTQYPEQYLGRIAVVEAAERILNSVSLRQPRIKYIRPEGSKAATDCIIED